MRLLSPSCLLNPSAAPILATTMLSSRKRAAANGFGTRSLTIEQAWLLYRERYPAPSDNRVPSNGWWMAPNVIPVPPVSLPGTTSWAYQVHFHWCCLPV